MVGTKEGKYCCEARQLVPRGMISNCYWLRPLFLDMLVENYPNFSFTKTSYLLKKSRVWDVLEIAPISFKSVFMPAIALDRFIFICLSSDVTHLYTKPRRIALLAALLLITLFLPTSHFFNFKTFMNAEEFREMAAKEDYFDYDDYDYDYDYYDDDYDYDYGYFNFCELSELKKM